MSEQDFDLAVFSYYMKHGKPCTAKELAEDCGESIAKVRKAINDSKYRSASVTVDRPVRERNYGTIRCHRRVNAYHPCLSRLREELIALRNKCRGV